MRNLSPLRYPGGKAVLAKFLKTVIYDNGLQGCTYIEPFAGGAGAGVELLARGHVDQIVINDADRAVYCFWKAVRHRAGELISRIQTVPLTVEEWRRQKQIYCGGGRQKEVDLGFAAFYLNRCNRSGIIKNGGPIGGIEQQGEWRIDARFNREQLATRVDELASYGDRILVSNEDAKDFLRRLDSILGSGAKFIYVDPPYYFKGRELYLNHLAPADHRELACILDNTDTPWVLSYDDVIETRGLYSKHSILPFSLRYSAHKNSREGGEILVAPNHVALTGEARSYLSSLGRPSVS